MSFTKDVIEDSKEKSKEDLKKELFKDTYDVSKAISYQKQLCKEKQWPLFAPSNGVCWACGKQIYEKISVYEAQTSLVTGCPHCHYSYVE